MKANNAKAGKPSRTKTNNNKRGKGMNDNNGSTNRHTTRNGSSDRDYGDVNDASFYFLDDVVKSQITNVSFNQYVGVPFNISRTADGSEIAIEPSSIAAFLLNPSAGVGNNTGMTTGVDLAALNTYTKLSANNAKTTQYAPQDITMLYLAMGQLIALTSEMARAFGVTRLYNVRNRSYPRRVLNALGYNYDDLIDNFANYKTTYNSLMVLLSAIPIPANVPYFQKCAQMYSYIYLDMEGSSMAQTYAFVPYSTWKIDEVGSATGTKLVTVPLHDNPAAPNRMGAMLTKLEELIQALLNSSTLNVIYSDILRLADKEGLQLYKFTTIPDDYVVIPAYNPEIRKWINNMMIIGGPQASVDGHTPANDVHSDPDNNRIKYNPSFTTSYGGSIHHIMNFDAGNPSSDDIVDATRLMADVEADASHKSLALALPDYYCTFMVIYENKSFMVFGTNVMDGTNASFSDQLAAISNFDWAPFIYVLDGNGIVTNVIGDLNYFTTLDGPYLERMFDLGYQGLLSMR